MGGTREDQGVVTVTIDGEDTGTWEEKTGGNIGSDNTIIYPNAGEPVPIGGKKTPDTITLVRTVFLERDWPKIRSWQSKVGRSKKVVIKDQALDPDDNAWEEPHVRTGVLSECGEPQRNTGSSDAAKVTIVIQPTAQPG
jgi:hypothetical protein